MAKKKKKKPSRKSSSPSTKGMTMVQNVIVNSDGAGNGNEADKALAALKKAGRF